MEKPFIVVDRLPSELDWTLSKFYIDGIRRCVGVEDEKREVKVKGETCIKANIYPLGLRYSPKFSKEYFVDKDGYLNHTKTDRFNKEHEMIWVMNVPLFEFILIHWGNTDDDTDGCYIVGKDFATFDKQKGVSASRVTYIEIYPVIWKKIKADQAAGITTYIQYKDAV